MGTKDRIRNICKIQCFSATMHLTRPTAKRCSFVSKPHLHIADSGFIHANKRKKIILSVKYFFTFMT